MLHVTAGYYRHSLLLYSHIDVFLFSGVPLEAYLHQCIMNTLSLYVVFLIPCSKKHSDASICLKTPYCITTAA